MDGLAHAAVAAAPPAIERAELEVAIREQFGLGGKYTPLVSERDQNFHLAADDGNEYVAKVTSQTEPAIVSDFQIAALLYLEPSGIAVPEVIRTCDGSVSGVVNVAGHDHMLRLVSYLPGVQLASVAVDRDIAFDFGAGLAKLDVELRAFSHPGDQPVLLWDMRRASELRGLITCIDGAETRVAVERALDDFDGAVAPGLGQLRTQVIHGDANPGNVLIEPDSRRVAGFIDFGDMLRAPVVCDIAIAAAYLRSDESNPLELVAPFVAGYESVSPIQRAEKSLLFDLVRTRLATTITLLFWRLRARDADDPYREKTLRDESDAMRFLGALDAYGRSGFLRAIAGAG